MKTKLYLRPSAFIRGFFVETHGTKFELARHFLARMFDSEMFSARGQWQSLAVGAFALAIPAGLLLLDPPYFHKPIDPSPETLRAVATAGQLATFTLIFAITGVIALLAWQSLFPSRRDYLALAGLPVESRQIFAARFAAVVVLSMALTLIMGLLPSLIAPHQFTAETRANLSPVIRAAARATASSLGCLFVFFAIVTIQGLLVNALPPRLFDRLSAYVQGALVAAFFLAGSYSFFIVDWRQDAIARLPNFGAWAPPVWFFGLHQAIVGDRDPFFTAMASRGLIAASGSVVCAGLMYLLAYGRYRRRLLESPDVAVHRRARKWSLLRLLSREPRQEAILEFMATVLSRSRIHRLVLMAYAGAALAAIVNSVLIVSAVKKWSAEWKQILQFVVLYWPIGLAFIALAGIRHSFAMPVEWRANWLFQITESQGRREWMSAVERFVIVCAIAPIYLVSFPVATAVLGWPMAARITALQLLVSLAAFELLFYSWQQLPFTCSYVPGKRPLAGLLAIWIAVLGLLVPVLSKLVAIFSHFLPVFVFFLGLLGAAWLWARRRRREGWGESKLIYEDLHEAVANLGIKELTYRSMSPREASGHVSGDVPEALPEGFPETLPQELSEALPEQLPAELPKEVSEEGPWWGGPPGPQPAPRPAPESHPQPVTTGQRLLRALLAFSPAGPLTGLLNDLRYGLRTLRASPGFAAVALISLSLGICIATCALSEMNGIVLRNVPQVAKPDELVGLQLRVSYPNYQRYREHSELFSSALAYVAPVPFGVSFGGRTERIWGHLVTPSYFSTLGVRPALGSFFDPDREQPGQAPAVVVSHRFWQNYLGSDPSILGKTLRINDHLCTVIGVGPREFLGASPLIFVADLWMPILMDARVTPELSDNVLERRDRAIFRVVGRLKPGITMAGAEAELDAAAQQLEQDYGALERAQKGRRVTLVAGGKLFPLRKQDLPFFTSLLVVMAGLVMLIAGANVANMMLARAAGRRREIAVRLAVGGSRCRIIRQLLTESMIVAAGAGLLGFLGSAWLLRLGSQMRMPLPMPVAYDFQPDARVLLFTVALTVFAGLGFGLAPALQATRSDLSTALKEGGDIRLRRYRRLSLRNVLLVSQVAGSLTLLVILGLLSLGIQSTMGIQAGFNPRNLYLISLDPVRDGYSGAQATAFFEKLLDRVKVLPSVTAASLTETVPVSMPGDGVKFSTPAAGAGAPRVIGDAIKHVVGRDYFDTAGIPILLGRSFREDDEASDATAVIVSEALVRVLWKGEEALGRRIEIGDDAPVPAKIMLPGSYDYRPGVSIKGRRQSFDVVGVARDVAEGLVVQKPRPTIYFPLRPADYARPSLLGVTLMVRAVPGVDAIAAVRREISALDDKITPFNARSMPEQIEQFMSPLRVASWTYRLIGIFGLILASVGLAGVTAYSVTQRRHEIGIRMALGARSRNVLGLVMKEGVALVAAGTILGLAGASAGVRFLSAMNASVGKVTSTNTSNPVVLIGGPLLLAGLALAACYLPARKSLHIDPVVALRQE